MNKESKLNLNASYYAISHCDTGKTYNGLEVHKMLCDAYIAGNNDNDEEIRRALINVFTAHKDYEIFLLGLKTNTNETTSRDEFAQSVLRGAAINLITWIDYHAAEGNMCLSNMECKDVEDALVSGDWNKIYAYMKKKLEKQDEQKSDDKIEPTDYNSIDPHFGKSIDKDEPKFHEGDWIIRSAECFKHNTYLIKEAKDYYVCEELKGRRVTFTFNDVHKNFKLWTISDAKDGDVLCYETKDEFIIFIYKNGHAHYHCCYSNGHLTTVDSFFVIEKYLLCYLHPATKEQRDTLMKAMADAGYTFDFEKKELKKVEDENYDGEDYGIDSLFHAQRILEKTLGSVEGYQTDDGILSHKCAIAAVNKLYKQKPAEWSEEDEHTLQGIIDEIQANKNQAPDYDLETYDRFLSWLKSLKNKVAPQKQWEQKGETLSGWWVARDKNGELYVYNVKPERNVLSWEVTNGTYIGLSQKLFPDLKWEDEPIEVDVIIKPKTT